MKPVAAGYTLYGSQGSGSASVEIALERTGAPFRVVRASSWEPDSAQDELVRLNPLKQIPTLLLPDGSVLTESAAILIHLGLAFPAAGLLPVASAARAQAIRGLVFIAANCYSAVSIIDFPERWIDDPVEAVNERVRRAARRRLHLHWEMFADSFPAQPFLSGEGPGALDYLAAVVSRWSGTRSHLRSHRPAFFAALERIEAHPHVAPVFARHWPG
jgi:GST-like protein